ncbi:MAG TPA: hypothetical protein VMU99_07515 [Acidimicrobiales bacterium]|nr:hypothetical protein [Acidimicrobiales bacterium]
MNPSTALGATAGGNSRAALRGPLIPGVGERTVLYLDRSRTTFNYLTGAVTPGRRLINEIRYPSSERSVGERADAPVLYRTAPYPVIVFAEGYRARPDLYAKLLDTWVREGYVVVSPEFPDTTYPATDAAIDAGYPHGNPEDDLVNEPGDIAFVLSQLARFTLRPRGLLHGLVNLNEVILAGQSDGAALVGAYAFDMKYALNRTPIRAVAIFAGYEISADSARYEEPVSGVVPALIIQSAADTCNEPELSVQMYNHIRGEKFFLRINGATHLGPFDGSDIAGFDAVRNMSLRFFAHALTPATVSAAAVLKAGRLSGIGVPSMAPSVASIPLPAGSPYCAPAY